jgi:diguanylate cyclase
MAVMVRKISLALIGLLVLGLLVQVVATFGPFERTLMDTTTMQWIYDGILLGTALLCGVRVVARSEERVAWSILALGLAVYAGGNIYWSQVLADLEEAPFPSVADGLWLVSYPLFYVAIVLLVRSRMPRLGVRLWLDGLIAALTVAALSAAVVFKAVRGATGGDTWAIITNLAYPPT